MKLYLKIFSLLLVSSVPKVETNDEVDGSIVCHNDANIRIPYQRLDTFKNVDIIQQFLAIAYKKFFFIKNEWILGLFFVSTYEIPEQFNGIKYSIMLMKY